MSKKENHLKRREKSQTRRELLNMHETRTHCETEELLKKSLVGRRLKTRGECACLTLRTFVWRFALEGD